MIHRWADQGVQVGVPAVEPLRRGGEAQTLGSGAVQGGGTRRSTGEVMALVEDQQAESVSEPVHVQGGAVVGGHGDRPDAGQAVAEDPGVVSQSLANAAPPLVHQIANGGDDERGDRHVGQDLQGDLRLAGPGRHDDDALPLGKPGGAGFFLFGAERMELRMRPVDDVPSRDTIGDRRARLIQELADGGVMQSVAEPGIGRIAGPPVDRSQRAIDCGPVHTLQAQRTVQKSQAAGNRPHGFLRRVNIYTLFFGKRSGLARVWRPGIWVKMVRLTELAPLGSA